MSGEHHSSHSFFTESSLNISLLSNFNHVRSPNGECVLAEGAEPLNSDTSWETCNTTTRVWYERTAYRKISYSSCEGGLTLDKDTEHPCNQDGLAYESEMNGFWISIAILGIVVTAVTLIRLRRVYTPRYVCFSQL